MSYLLLLDFNYLCRACKARIFVSNISRVFSLDSLDFCELASKELIISRVSVSLRAVRGQSISRDLLKIQRPNGSGGNLLRSTLDSKIFLDFLSPSGRTIIS